MKRRPNGKLSRFREVMFRGTPEAAIMMLGSQSDAAVTLAKRFLVYYKDASRDKIAAAVERGPVPKGECRHVNFARSTSSSSCSGGSTATPPMARWPSCWKSKLRRWSPSRRSRLRCRIAGTGCCRARPIMRIRIILWYGLPWPWTGTWWPSITAPVSSSCGTRSRAGGRLKCNSPWIKPTWKTIGNWRTWLTASRPGPCGRQIGFARMALIT